MLVRIGSQLIRCRMKTNKVKRHTNLQTLDRGKLYGPCFEYTFSYNYVYNYMLDIILHTTQIISVRNSRTARSRQIAEIVENVRTSDRERFKCALSASVSRLFSFCNEPLVHTWSENKLFQPLTKDTSEIRLLRY